VQYSYGLLSTSLRVAPAARSEGHGTVMESAQWQKVAIGAGVLAVVASILTGRLQRWLRIVLVAGLAVLACGAGLFAYRNVTEPRTLTIAVGSTDGDAAKIISTFATRMASTNSAVRLKVLDRGTAPEAIKAFASGDADRLSHGPISAISRTLAKSWLLLTGSF